MNDEKKRLLLISVAQADSFHEWKETPISPFRATDDELEQPKSLEKCMEALFLYVKDELHREQVNLKSDLEEAEHHILKEKKHIDKIERILNLAYRIITALKTIVLHLRRKVNSESAPQSRRLRNRLPVGPSRTEDALRRM